MKVTGYSTSAAFTLQAPSLFFNKKKRKFRLRQLVARAEFYDSISPALLDYTSSPGQEVYI